MKQTITIDMDVRDGYELKYNPETRTIEEVKKEPIRSRSWEEFCNNHPRIIKEYYINGDGSISSITECTRKHCNDLATKEDAEAIVALIQLTRLHDEWVDDWEIPTDRESAFWTICNTTDEGITVRNWYAGHTFLVFPTKEMTEEFLNCFRDLIVKAKKFI